MDDRELLEAAAKAAGIEGGSYKEAEGVFDGGILYSDRVDCLRIWNPLTDSGDALDLAVKLGIGLAGSESHVWACKLHMCDIHEPRGSDPYAATRRAIVRAAAELAPKD